MARPKTGAGSYIHGEQRGTVLLATAIVIIAVAGMSAVMMMRSQNNVIKYRHDRREVQADYVADSAVSLGVSRLNHTWLPNNNDVGSMSGKVYVLHSGDDQHAPIQVQGSGLHGHPKQDMIDNDGDGSLSDDPSDNNLVDPAEDPVDAQGNYEGGIYRVRLREWVENPTNSTLCTQKTAIGAQGIDDDGDGKTDECGEVNGYTNSQSRKFTMVVEASYGNYTIEKRVYSSAEQTSAGMFGIYSEGDLTVKSNSEIDSYDSPPYIEAEARKPGKRDGNVGAEEGLSIAQNAEVYGDAEWGESKDIKNPAAVRGEIRPLGSKINHKIWTLRRSFKSTDGTETVAPTDSPVEIKNDLEKLTVQKGGTAIITNTKPITIGPDYNKKKAPTAVSSGKSGGGGGGGQVPGGGTGGGGGSVTPATIKVKSQAQVFIQGGWEDGAATRIVLNGPTSPSKTPTRIYISDRFETNNRTDITVTGRVEMKVVRSVDIGSKSEVDVTTDKTPHFSLQVGGSWLDSTGNFEEAESPGEKLRLKPKNTWQGVISAPALQGKKALRLFPKTEYFGALIGRNVTLKSKTKFHYDERVSTSCYLPSVNCSWVSAKSNSWVVAQRGQGPVN